MYNTHESMLYILVYGEKVMENNTCIVKCVCLCVLAIHGYVVWVAHRYHGVAAAVPTNVGGSWHYGC